MHVDVTTRFGWKGEGDGGREEGFDFVLARIVGFVGSNRIQSDPIREIRRSDPKFLRIRTQKYFILFKKCSTSSACLGYAIPLVFNIKVKIGLCTGMFF